MTDSHLQYPKEDHHEVRETFADSLGLLTYDGRTLRFELTCSRVDALTPEKEAKGRRHVVARLVLTPEAAGELYKRLDNIAAQLQQAMRIAHAATKH
jgi:hypothetical protein